MIKIYLSGKDFFIHQKVPGRKTGHNIVKIPGAANNGLKFLKHQLS